MEYRKVTTVGEECIEILGDSDLEVAVATGDSSNVTVSGKQAYALGLNDLCIVTAEGDWGISLASGTGCESIAKGSHGLSVSYGDENISSSYGKFGTAVACGPESSVYVEGENSIGLANGADSTARGTVGSYLVLTEYSEYEDSIIDIQVIRIDGVKYKANVDYTLKDGMIVDVSECE